MHKLKYQQFIFKVNVETFNKPQLALNRIVHKEGGKDDGRYD